VNSEVNAGVTEICEAFLIHPEQFPVESINKLRSTIQALLKYCSFALRLSERLGGTDQEVFLPFVLLYLIRRWGVMPLSKNEILSVLQYTMGPFACLCIC